MVGAADRQIPNLPKENIVTYIQNGVTVKDITAVTKRTVAEVEVEVEAECRDLGLFLGTDWAGRPAVSEVDAERLVSGSARRTREDEAAWSSHLALCQQWTARRDELVRSVQRDAELAAQRADRGGGDAAQAGVEAGRSAGRELRAQLARKRRSP